MIMQHAAGMDSLSQQEVLCSCCNWLLASDKSSGKPWTFYSCSALGTASILHLYEGFSAGSEGGMKHWLDDYLFSTKAMERGGLIRVCLGTSRNVR